VKLAKIRGDERGTTAVEFGLTAPIFIMVLSLIMVGGLLLWTQLGLQHGAEMAARCASVNKTTCGNSADTQSYAAQQAYGLNPLPSTFTVSTAACGTLVTANYTFNFIVNYFGTPTLALGAQACFPT
jgi:Flp pilus assembly protein TadG